MKKHSIKVEIEGVRPLLFNRFPDPEASLGDEEKSKGAVAKWRKEQFFTTDNEIFNGGQPAIPISHWLTGAMHECASKVKMSGRQTLKKYVNGAFVVKETRVPIGNKKHLEAPEYIDRSSPSNYSGQRHYQEMPGFNEGWTCKFTIESLDGLVTDAKIRELLDLCGFLQGIGARHGKAAFGRFIVKSFG